MPVRQHPTDPWDIPESLFGPVPEEFYAVVGRVTMLAALVDDMLLRLAWSLTDAVQSVHSGKSGGLLEEVCRAAVVGFSVELATDVETTLDEVNEARQLRNAVVHSVWPNPTVDGAFGWRAVIPKKNDGQQTKAFQTNREAFEQLIDALVDQIARLDQLQQRGHIEKAQR